MGSWTSPNPQTPGLDPDPDPDPDPNPSQAQTRPHPQPQPRAQPKQVESFDVGAGDYVLCFSDGVSGNLALNEIARLVSACEGQSAEVAACVDVHICICTHMPHDTVRGCHVQLMARTLTPTLTLTLTRWWPGRSSPRRRTLSSSLTT